MKKVIILGSGSVGRAMAVDLCPDYKVTCVDFNPKPLESLSSNYPVKSVTADLSDPVVISGIVAEADLVIGALPGHLGFSTLKAVIDAGKNTVDISFFEEDPFILDEPARQKGVTAVVDCGVAPGLANIILGFHEKDLEISRYECYVGGLPRTRILPFQYKAPFSPIDVIAEYTRPARMVLDGKLVVKAALSGVEHMEIPEIGTLEAFYTDGLRSLIKTMNIENMIEKTLRYPGHAEIMRIFRDTGFFNDSPIHIKGTVVKPLDLTTALLFPKWHLKEGEQDITVLKLIIAGRKAQMQKNYIYTLVDYYDTKGGTSSMARTTGYTCSAVARLILDGRYHRRGICPPEYIGQTDGCMKRIKTYLEDRRVIFNIEAF